MAILGILGGILGKSKQRHPLDDDGHRRRFGEMMARSTFADQMAVYAKEVADRADTSAQPGSASSSQAE